MVSSESLTWWKRACVLLTWQGGTLETGQAAGMLMTEFSIVQRSGLVAVGNTEALSHHPWSCEHLHVHFSVATAHPVHVSTP